MPTGDHKTTRLPSARALWFLLRILVCTVVLVPSLRSIAATMTCANCMGVGWEYIDEAGWVDAYDLTLIMAGDPNYMSSATHYAHPTKVYVSSGNAKTACRRCNGTGYEPGHEPDYEAIQRMLDDDAAGILTFDGVRYQKISEFMTIQPHFIVRPVSGGKLCVAREWGPSGLVTDCIYDAIENRYGNAVVRIGDKYGYLSAVGTQVTSVTYDSVGDFHGALAVVTRNGKTGVVAVTGEVMVQPEWDDVIMPVHGTEWQFRVMRGGKWGVIGHDGRMLVAPEWDGLGKSADTGEFVVTREGKFGLLGREGRMLVEPTWDALRPMTLSVAVTGHNGVGLIDRKGNQLVTPKWEDAFLVGEGRALVEGPNGAGVVRTSDQAVLIPPRFDNTLTSGDYEVAVLADGTRSLWRDGVEVVAGGTYDLLVAENGFVRAHRGSDVTILGPDFQPLPLSREGLDSVERCGDHLVARNWDNVGVLLDRTGRELGVEAKEIRCYPQAVWAKSYGERGRLHGLDGTPLAAEVVSVRQTGAELIGQYPWDGEIVVNARGQVTRDDEQPSDWIDLDRADAVEKVTAVLEALGYEHIEKTRRRGMFLAALPHKITFYDEDGGLQVRNGYRYGVVDYRGEVVVPLIWGQIWVFDEDALKVILDGRGAGLVGFDNKILLWPGYQKIGWEEDAVEVQVNGREFSYRRSHLRQRAEPPELEDWSIPLLTQSADTPDGPRFGLVDAQNEWVVDPKWLTLHQMRKSAYAVVQDERGWGYLDTRTGEAWDIRFDKVDGTLAWKDGLAGIYNVDQGEWLMAPQFSEVRDLNTWQLRVGTRPDGTTEAFYERGLLGLPNITSVGNKTGDTLALGCEDGTQALMSRRGLRMGCGAEQVKTTGHDRTFIKKDGVWQVGLPGIDEIEVSAVDRQDVLGVKKGTRWGVWDLRERELVIPMKCSAIKVGNYAERPNAIGFSSLQDYYHPVRSFGFCKSGSRWVYYYSKPNGDIRAVKLAREVAEELL